MVGPQLGRRLFARSTCPYRALQGDTALTLKGLYGRRDKEWKKEKLKDKTHEMLLSGRRKSRSEIETGAVAGISVNF